MSQYMGNGTSTLDAHYNIPSEFNMLSNNFNKYHTTDMNIFLHFITTPLGILGVLSLIRSFSNASTLGVVLSALYMLSLIPLATVGTFTGTGIILFILLVVCRIIRLNAWQSIFMIIAGYLLQDLAHLASNEPTFQATYSNGGHVILFH